MRGQGLAQSAPQGLPHDIGTIITHANGTSTLDSWWLIAGTLTTLALLAAFVVWRWCYHRKTKPAEPWDAMEQGVQYLEEQLKAVQNAATSHSQDASTSPKSEALYRQAREVVSEARRLHNSVEGAAAAFLARTDKVVYQGRRQQFGEDDLTEVKRIVNGAKIALTERQRERPKPQREQSSGRQRTGKEQSASRETSQVESSTRVTENYNTGRESRPAARSSDLLGLPSDRISQTSSLASDHFLPPGKSQPKKSRSEATARSPRKIGEDQS